MLGNVDFFRDQMGLLMGLCTMHGEGYEKAGYSSRKKFDRFFSRAVSNPRRRDSLLGFIEEMEWVLIKDDFYGVTRKYRKLSPCQVLRKLVENDAKPPL